MLAKILQKSDHHLQNLDTNVIHVQTPSIIELGVGPEQVRAFERQGADLKLTLLDGHTVVIQNFFVHGDDGARSDLVLQDGEGVAWWGQYPEQWSGFQFTEIQDGNTGVIPAWLKAGLALLGLGALGAAAAGGGGGGGDDSTPAPNHPALIGGTHTGGVTEDTAVVAGQLKVSGALTVSDADAGQSHFQAGAGIPVGATLGHLVIDANGHWTYQVDNSLPGVQRLGEGQTRTETFQVQSADGTKGIITVTITGTNDAPTLVADVAGVKAAGVVDGGNAPEAGTPTATGNVLANDHDIDVGDTLNVTGVEVTGGVAGTLGAPLVGTYGTLVLNADGSYTYQLDNALAATRQLASGVTATDSFTYTASDGRDEVTQTLIVTVTGTNDAPVIDGAGSVILGEVIEAGGIDNHTLGIQSATGMVVAADVDTGDTQHWSIVGTPDTTYGVFEIDAASGQWTYTLDDGKAATQALAAGDTRSLTYTVQVTDAHGATAMQDVTVNIQGSNDVPVVTNGAGAVTEDVALTSGMLVAQGTVANGQALTILDVDHDQNAFDSSSVAFGSNSLGGSTALGDLAVDADGTWTYKIDNSLGEVQSLGVGQTLTETFTVKSADGTATSTVTVTVTGTNDAPVASDDVVSVLEDTPLTGNVLANDHDVDAGDTLNVVRFSVDGHTYSAGSTAILAGGLLTINSDGSYTFTPEPNWNGAVPAATYTISDGHGGVDTALLDITVTPVNDAPVPMADVAAVKEAGVADGGNSPLAGTPTATGNVLINDTDVDGDTLTVSGIALGGTVGAVGTALAGAYGSLVINADGSYTYTLDDTKAATQALASGEKATEVFTYTVFDGTVGEPATLTVTVTGTNDAPVIDAGASTVSGSVTEAGGVNNGTADAPAVAGAVVATDVDAGDTQHWSVTGSPDATYGTFAIDAATGQWTYTLDDTKAATQALKAGQTVDLTYTVQVTDAHGATATQNVAITITGSNDVPVLSGTATGAVVEAGGLNNAVLNHPDAQGTVHIEDPDAGQSSFLAPTSLNGTYGTFTFNTVTGGWSYQLDNSRAATQLLAQGDKVTDTLTVTSADGTASQDIVVTITGSNDVPVVTNGVGSVTEDVDVGAEVAGMLTAHGTVANGQALTIVDADHDQSTFDTGTVAFASNSLGASSALGNLVVNANGTWDYQVDNSLSAVQSLAVGQTITETFTVKSADGTAMSTVTVTINGANDAPYITSAAAAAEGSVVESGVDNTGHAIGTASATGTLTGGDIDSDDDPASLRWSLQGSGQSAAGTYGSLTLNAVTGKWTYTLDDANPATQALKATDVKTETFTAVVTDSHGATATQTITVTVNGSNDAPENVGTIANQTSQDADTGIHLDVSSSFADVDGDTLTYTVTGLPAGLSISAAGVITGTVDHSASQGMADGKYAVTVTATDPSGATSSQHFTWTVTNPAPIAHDDTVSGNEDTVITGNVITGAITGGGTSGTPDSDPDGDTLSVLRYTVDGHTYTAGSSAAITGGLLTLNADGSYTFTPDANWNGPVPPVTYVLTDGEGGLSTAQLNIEVNSVNDVPEAADKTLTIAEDGTHVFVASDFGFSDSADGNNLQAVVIGSLPTEGVLTLDGTAVTAGQSVLAADIAAGKLVFTPAADANGVNYAGFTFQVQDDGGTANGGVDTSATHTITVNVTPVQDVTDDTATTNEDTPVVMDVLANDSFEGSGKAVTAVNGTTINTGDTVTVDHGSVTLGSDGKLTFTPDANFNGTASFTYTANSSTGVAETATATVTVNPVNDPPQGADNSFTIDEDTSHTFTAADFGFSDPVEGNAFKAVTITTLPTAGTLTLDGVAVTAGQSVDVAYLDAGKLVFTPAPNANGTNYAGFTFQVQDNGGTANGGQDTDQSPNAIAFNVTPVNDAPANVGTVADQANQDADKDISLSVAGNFTDVDGDRLTYSATGLPTGLAIDAATGVISGDVDHSASQGAADGKYSVTVTAIDPSGATSTQHFTWTVTNPAPIAHDDTVSGNEDTVITGNVIEGSIAGGVAGASGTEDSDPDGDTLSVLRYTVDGHTYAAGDSAAITGGLLTLDADGSYIFTPDANWNGTVPSVTYVLSDGQGGLDTAQLNITVTPVNDAPVPMADVAAVKEAGVADGGNSPLAGTPTATGNVLINDTDVDGDTLTVSGIALGGTVGAVGTALAGAYGSLVINADGNYTYTLDDTKAATQALASGEKATEVFTYTVFDGTVGEPATLTVTVTGTNDAPVIDAGASTVSGSVTEAGGVNNGTADAPAVAGAVVATDVDAGDTQHWSVTGSPDATYGTFAIDAATGQWTYTLDDTKAATQALKAGQTVDLTYTVQVTDAHGATATQNVAITITGSNDVPVLSGTATGAVVEAGGLNNAVLNHPDAQGTVHIEDPDAGQSSFLAPTSLNGTYGTFTFNTVTGGWSYQLDNSRAATQLLAQGDKVTDTLTVTSADGTASQDIVVTITGSNDVPVVTNGVGSVTEDVDVGAEVAGMLTAHGTVANGQALTIVDADHDQSTFDTGTVAFASNSLGASSALGNLVVNANGTWDYQVDNSLSAVQSLAVGQTITETFTVKSADGTAMSTVTVTIHGSNDAPTISGAATGNVAEDGVQTATGQLQQADVDVGDTHTWSISGANGAYGTLTVDQTGKWVYVLDNAAAQEIAAGQTVQDKITVQVTDAAGATAAQLVTVTIAGQNDAPVIQGSSTLTGAVTETGGTSGSSTDHTATGHIDFTDVDTTPTADTHTVQSITPLGAGYLGTLSTGAVNDTTHQVDWTFTVADSALDQLAVGQVVTQAYNVVISDGHGGTAVTTVTVTITGANDAPVINTTTSDLSTTVTEIADGAAGENTFVHGEEGFIHFSDLDTLDTTHTVSVAPQGNGTGYVGDFTITPVDNVNDQVQWQFTVSDSVLDSWPATKEVQQKYDITISDGHGGTTTETVTVTLVGTNDRPMPEDDLSLVKSGEPATEYVLTNDHDVDTGTVLKVTGIDGSSIDADHPVTIVRGGDTLGVVSLSGNGTLTFVPDPSFKGGHIDIPYTVDDGSGTSNATATANWAINVVGVDIVDNASPASPTTGDTVLASIDDLQHVNLSGNIPEGGTLTSLTVTDGTNTVTVPPGSVTINPDGSFTTTADLSGLADGTLTVTMDVEDPAGTQATVTDTILKDTVTTVIIDPVTVEDGQVPTITGTGEPGSTITLTINGTQVTVPGTVDTEGKWSYTPAAPLSPNELTLDAHATDKYGNTDDNSRQVASLTVEDQVAGQDADVLVHESGLATGSHPDPTTTQADSTFTIGTIEGSVEHLVIGGTVAGGVVSGGTEVTLAQLQNVGTPAIAPIATAYGTLTITGYDASTGVVSFTYAITAPQTDGSATPAAESTNILDETIQIAVVDHDGDTRVSHIVAGVQDDVPTADSGTSVSLSEGSFEVGYVDGAQMGTATNLLANDTQGADGARVYQITYNDSTGSSKTVDVPSGGNTGALTTQYGSLTVYSNGDWTYTSNESADHDKATGDGENLSDSFTYTLVDGDGDISNSATQPIVVTDTVPTVGTPDAETVYEAGLPLGSTPSDTGTPVSKSGSLGVTPSKDTEDTKFTDDSSDTSATVQTLEALGLKSDGQSLQYVVSSDGHTLTAYNSATYDTAHQIFTVVITDPAGANPGYTFKLTGSLDQGGAASSLLDIPFTVTDSDGDPASGTIQVTVMDDAPTGNIEATINEDGHYDLNTTADSTPDNTSVSQGGALTGVANGDGGKDYTTGNGTVTVNADGTLTYTPDHNFSGSESFSFTTADGTTRTVEMTVNPVSDAPTLSDVASINTLEDTAVALGFQAPVITDDGSGTGNNDVSERLGAVTLSGFLEGAVLQDGSGNTLHTFVSGDNGTITIVLSDDGVPLTGASGTLTLTEAEFEALKVLPPTDSGTNFTVTMSVTSYEVDAGGNVAQVGGHDVAGATATTSVNVYVEAVTDDASLTFDTGKTSNVTNVVGDVTYGGDTEATVTVAEDTTFNVKDILSSSFQDLDGSEVRSITITNGTGQSIEINGHTLEAGDVENLSARTGSAGQTGGISSFPDIQIGGVGNYSGNLNGITITVNAQDKDADGYWDGAKVNGSVDGVAEADTTNNTVTLNLRVNPVAGDVALSNVETNEDTPVQFLQNVHVTDTDGFGTEQIGVVSFTAPVGWGEVQAPAGGGLTADGWQMTQTGSGTTGDPYVYTITFNEGWSGTVLDEAGREAVLGEFTIKPPAQSSLDATFDINVTSTDSNTVGGSLVSDTKTVTLPLTIQVDPVAEKVAPVGDPSHDTDGDGTADLTMTPGHDYATAGSEDTWFDLNQATGDDSTFKLGDGWTNEDTSEQTYALLTPVLINGDGSNTSAIGSQFKWTDTDGEHTATFTGDAIQVPVASLDSLQFQAAPNFSGMFKIDVQAYTVDADENGTGVTDTATSGSAELTNVLITPVADEVTLALNGRASGLEDTAIPLTIHPTSSDPSETFIVTIANIPVGATLVYGSGATEQTFTATTGHTTWTIPSSSNPGPGDYFNSSTPLTIQAPPNSNAGFTLQVSAQSVDTLTVDEHGVSTTYTDTSNPSQQLTIDVTVKGVPDPAALGIVSPTYTEVDLDSGTKQVHLQDIVTSASPTDTDGSEVLTLRISGLPDGFSLSGGTLLPLSNGEEPTGTQRVWVVTAGQLADVVIKGPENYSGTVSFSVAAVTTENDGASSVWPPTSVSFTVTPSPEATTTTSAQLTEDVLSNIGLAVAHHNGDNDETLTSVRIPVDDAATSKFTLYLDDGTGHPQTLAEALAGGLITTETDGGTAYYVLDANQISHLSAEGASQLDGDLGGFDFQYQINDSNYGSTPSGDSVTTGWQDAHFDLNATPVTDQPVASITGIVGTTGVTTASDAITMPDDRADPDTATLTAPDKVTVTLNVASPDEDGSEHLIRVVIDGVPAGVTVEGGQFVADPNHPTDPSQGYWILVYAGADAKAIAGGGLSLPVTFDVSQQAGGLENQAITLTAQVQDEPGQGTSILSDSVTWHLTTGSWAGSGDVADIDKWAYDTDFNATEDSSFTLAQAIDASITVHSTAQNVFTITLQNLPEGTVVGGMVQTTVADAGGGSHDVWTASISSTPDMSESDIQQMLQTLMGSITIMPPPNSNENNAAGAFHFDAQLTTSVASGATQSMDIPSSSLVIPVTPVTDAATISIGLDTSVDTNGLNESDTSIPIVLTVSDAADRTSGILSDGKVYLQVTSETTGLQGGTLTVDGTTYTTEHVTGVSNVPDGDYYVVSGVTMGETLKLVYTPVIPEGQVMSPGSVKVTAYTHNQEANSAEASNHTPLVSEGEGTLEVAVSNDGVTVTSTASTGDEAATTNATEVPLDLSVTLNDNDGSEKINSVLLSGVPNGFLVMTGTDAAHATLASNAGGSGDTNTWVISDASGSLPAYVAIVPPLHWSGTLSDLSLSVQSGETRLDDKLTQSFDLADVKVDPVANGLTLAATNTFGKEGGVIPLNLNASMQDSTDASTGSATDSSTESTSLTVKGLGEHAAFYLGSALIDGTLNTAGGGVAAHDVTVSYDSGSGAYTITGLSQYDLDQLGFVQANAALADQNSTTAGTQLHVDAWTVESGDPSHLSAVTSADITVNMTAQLATSGNDTLIWTGQPIDARSGSDTVALRYGEQLSGEQLSGVKADGSAAGPAVLTHVEALDMSIGGANGITGLTPEQVQAILGTGSNASTTLTIKGTSEDSLSLSDQLQVGGTGPSGTWSYDSATHTATGTIVDGLGHTSTVTLVVSDDVHVSLDGGAQSQSITSLSLGLESLSETTQTDESAFLFQPESAALTLDSVLSPESDTSSQSSVASFLPAAQSSPASSTPAVGDAALPSTSSSASVPGVADPSGALVPRPDDELQHSHPGVVALA